MIWPNPRRDVVAAIRAVVDDYLSRSIVVIGSLCLVQRDNAWADTVPSGSTVSGWSKRVGHKQEIRPCRWFTAVCCNQNSKWRTRKHAQMRSHRAWLHVDTSWERDTSSVLWNPYVLQIFIRYEISLFVTILRFRPGNVCSSVKHELYQLLLLVDSTLSINLPLERDKVDLCNTVYEL